MLIAIDGLNYHYSKDPLLQQCAIAEVTDDLNPNFKASLKLTRVTDPDDILVRVVTHSFSNEARMYQMLYYAERNKHTMYKESQV